MNCVEVVAVDVGRACRDIKATSYVERLDVSEALLVGMSPSQYLSASTSRHVLLLIDEGVHNGVRVSRQSSDSGGQQWVSGTDW